MDYTSRRLSYVFLCMVPVLAIIVAAVRALRVPGVYQAIGGLLFAAIVIAAWILGARAIRSGAEGEQRLALAGVFLIVPLPSFRSSGSALVPLGLQLRQRT